MVTTIDAGKDTLDMTGPPAFDGFDHVSVPSHDLDDSIRFYRDVMGGELMVTESAFALFKIAGTRVGVGSAGTTFLTGDAEYPHMAFVVSADALVRMKAWLAACGVPSSDFWTRKGIETLMFFRDPSGNLIELFCHEGFDGADALPRGPARGHGTAIDVDALRYDTWSLPSSGN